MEVGHCLKSGFTIGLKQCQSGRLELPLHSFGDAIDQLECGGGLIFIQIEYRFKVGFQRDDDMTRIHLAHVHKNDMLIIFVHFMTRNLPGRDFAKHTFSHFSLLSVYQAFPFLMLE
jgi:hypothetical protein